MNNTQNNTQSNTITNERLAELERIAKEASNREYHAVEIFDITFREETVLDLLVEIYRLREIVGKLPVTADGVHVTHGLKLWCPRGHEVGNHSTRCYCVKGSCWDDGCQNNSGSGTHWRYDQCFASKDMCKDKE